MIFAILKAYLLKLSSTGLPALQPKEKATPYIDSQVDSMPARENPPYNFK